ncbi:hypothetical protein COT29_03705 [Candidatus Micrarchaeota archaeon CG08_land_8_20_14_0_20_59_11]|nr:MAG: hypothetical protein COT29_03705 [Candidatus Micrarchaeota archaeon CG08_land_8_20_14_0_20_59_11]
MLKLDPIQRKRVFHYLKLACLEPGAPKPDAEKILPPSINRVNVLSQLHYAHDRPTLKKLAALVRKGELHASADPKVLKAVSPRMLASSEIPKRNTQLSRDCKSIALALSHFPQTPEDLRKLLRMLDNPGKEQSVYDGRVASAMLALAETGTVIAFGHARMLSYFYLRPEALPAEARAAVAATQLKLRTIKLPEASAAVAATRLKLMRAIGA